MSKTVTEPFKRLNKEMESKWGEFLDDSSFGKFSNTYDRAVAGVVLENCQQVFGREGGGDLLLEAAPANNAGSYPSSPVAGTTMPLMPIIRRAMPMMMAPHMVGVQPMTRATGSVFYLQSRKTSQSGTEILFGEADTRFTTDPDAAGAGFTATVPLPQADADAYKAHPNLSTAAGEALGDGVGDDFSEVAFSIKSITVTAGTRALKAELTQELIDDARNDHGLDAKAELNDIMVQELLASQNRHVVRTIINNAKLGAAKGTTTAGTIDLSVDGSARWMAEKFQALLLFIEADANQILFGTRRGRGNFIICSADVASAFVAGGLLDNTSVDINVDGLAQDTFVGTVGRGRFKVFVDPYITATDFFVVGYKGPNNYEAGIFLCPYIPLQRIETVGENSFQPRIAYKMRYGLISNPFANSTMDGALTWNANEYYRKALVTNLLA